MTGKLESNADHFPTEKLQIAYIQTRVEGLALSHLAPRMRENSPRPFKTGEEIMEYLEKDSGVLIEGRMLETSFVC